MNALNARFGRQLVRLAAIGITQAGHGPVRSTAWAGRAAHRSPLYTTAWDELWQLNCG